MSFQNSCFKILSGCMEPVLAVNSTAVVEHAGADGVNAGDIAAFRVQIPQSREHDTVEVHWVTGKFSVSGKTYFLHSANNVPSLGIFSADELIGKVILVKNGNIMAKAAYMHAWHIRAFSLLVLPVCAIPAVFLCMPEKSRRTLLDTLRFIQLLFFLPFSHKKGSGL